MQLQVPIVDTERCKQLISKLNAEDADTQINDRVICAKLAGGKGIWKGEFSQTRTFLFFRNTYSKCSSSGDSGGPLMVPIFQQAAGFPFYLIGIASRTYGYFFLPNIDQIDLLLCNETLLGFVLTVLPEKTSQISIQVSNTMRIGSKSMSKND